MYYFVEMYMIVSSEFLEDVREYQGWEIDTDQIGHEGERQNYFAGLYFMVCFFVFSQVVKFVATKIFDNYLIFLWREI